MGYKCTALGCKSGYRSQKNQNVGEKITFHSYPLKDQNLCEKWIRANPRKDFVPSKHSRLCSLHFTTGDFVEMHNDSNAKRRLKYSSEMLLKRYLKKDAVPSIFPIVSGCSSKSRKSSKLTASVASSSGSPRRESKRTKSLHHLSEADDDISFLTIEEIRDRLLSMEGLPDGFELKMFNDRLLIYRLGVEENLPKIRACITVKNDNSRSVSLDGRVIDDILFKDLVPEVFQTLSQILEAMALVRAWCEEECEPSEKLEVAIIKCFKDDLDDIDASIKEEC